MLHIVLIEPEIPQNTGNIARTCAATGVHLILVHPLGFSLEDRYLRRAGLDYWKDLNLSEVMSVQDFFKDYGEKNLIFFSARARKSFFSLTFSPEQDTYFVFGKESSGLGASIIGEHQDSCYRLPLKEGTRSLNLSNTAAVAVYEYFRQLGFPGLALSDGGIIS